MRQYRMFSAFVASAAIVSSLAFAGGRDDTSKRSVPRERISAPIHYGDSMFAFADDEGVALVVFQCPAKEQPTVTTASEPVSYRFRYQSKGRKVVTGGGLLCERYKSDGASKFGVVNDGGQLRISAGHFQVEWSSGDVGMGWLYYKPEQIRVQLGNVRHFETVDLQRFSH